MSTVLVASTHTVVTLPPQGVSYKPYCDVGKNLAIQLRAEGADIVIALTHMREPSDLELARSVPEIDLIHAGHDHFYRVTHVSEDASGTTVVKSGCDFREFSFIELFLNSDETREPSPDTEVYRGERVSVSVRRVEVTKDIEANPEVKDVVERLSGEVKEKMNVPVGTVDVVFDARFEISRSQESAVGNLMTDILRRVYRCDVALICGGAIRSDDKYGPGEFTLRDVMLIFPFEDPCTVLRLTGKQLLSTLENGVSSYPKLDGRFPHVSGMRFMYDPNKPPGSRVVKAYVGEGKGTELDLDATYTAATRSYMAQGKDGFTALAEGEVVVDDENGHLMSVLLRNYFWQVRVVNKLHSRQQNVQVREMVTMWASR